MNIKCLHVITRLANGGAEDSVLELIRQLAEQGVYCDLAVGKELISTSLEKYPLPEQCAIHRIPHMVRNPHPIYDFKALQELRMLIKKNRYNIVHTHASKAGILGRLAAYKEKTPIIIGMIHGISFPPAMNIVARIVYKNLERYTAKKSSALVCVGEDLKQKYIDAHIGHPEQYSVIYTGMDLTPFQHVQKISESEKQHMRERFQIPNDPDTILLGTVARLEKRKNHHDFLSLFPEVTRIHPNVHYCIIGDGPEESALRSLAKQLHIDSHVTFTGYVKDVWNILSLVDIHCLTSLWEGLPRVLVQTSAAGIPNVCFKVDGAWEIIDHEKSGYIIPRGDTTAFQHVLCRLIENSALRTMMGIHAKKNADTRWSLEALGKDTYALYTDLLTKSA